MINSIADQLHKNHFYQPSQFSQLLIISINAKYQTTDHTALVFTLNKNTSTDPIIKWSHTAHRTFIFTAKSHNPNLC